MPDSEDYRIANQALARLGIGRITDFTGSTTVSQILNDQYDEWRKELLQDHPWKFATRRRSPGHFEVTDTEIHNHTNNFHPTGGHTFYDGEGPFQLTTTDTLPTGYLAETDYYVLVSGDNLSLATTPTGTAVTISDDGVGTMSLVRTPHNEWSYAHYLPSDCLRVTQLEDRDQSYQWVVEQNYVYHNVGTSVNINYIFDIQMSDVNFPMFKRALALKIAMDLSESGVKTTSVTQEIEKDYYTALQRAKSIDGQEGSPVLTVNGTWADEMGRIS